MKNQNLILELKKWMEEHNIEADEVITLLNNMFEYDKIGKKYEK